MFFLWYNKVIITDSKMFNSSFHLLVQIEQGQRPAERVEDRQNKRTK